MEVKDILKEAREKSGMSKDQVADELHVSHRTISDWEKGKTLPDVYSVIELSELYQISLDSLLRDDSRMVEKLEREARFEKVRKMYFSYAIICVLMVATFAFYFLSMMHISGSLKVDKSNIGGVIFIIVIIVACICNAILLWLADHKRSMRLGIGPIGITVIMLIGSILNFVVDLLGTYHEYSVEEIIIQVVVLVIFAGIFIAIINSFKSKVNKRGDME